MLLQAPYDLGEVTHVGGTSVSLVGDDRKQERLHYILHLEDSISRQVFARESLSIHSFAFVAEKWMRELEGIPMKHLPLLCSWELNKNNHPSSENTHSINLALV